MASHYNKTYIILPFIAYILFNKRSIYIIPVTITLLLIDT